MSRRVIVCGAGIVGAATAYHLARRGAEVVLVDRRGIAAAASGRAAGFLALDWCDGLATGPMARASFAMHAELGRELGVDIGYRRVRTSLVALERRGEQGAATGWLDGDARIRGQLGDERTTAQVDPRRLTRALVTAAERHGATMRLGIVEDVVVDAGIATGVRVDGETLAADAVVVAMGPWSAQAAPGLGLPPMLAVKGHSVLLSPREAMPAEALFVDDDHGGEAPEVLPRPDGTVYIAAGSQVTRTPDPPESVGFEPAAIDALRAVAGRLSTGLRGVDWLDPGACYRPLCADNVPAVGAVPGARGAHVATGHGPWGILLGPATGAALAERILDGASTTVDLGPFDPARLLRR